LRQQPLALVVRVKLSDAERSELPEVDAGKTSFKLGSNIVSGEPCYVYYRMYTPAGDIPPKHPIDNDDPSLARFDAKLVTPPYSVDSIKRFISKVEGKPEMAEPSAQVFASMLSEFPMDFKLDLDRGNSHTPGDRFTPEDPMVFVMVQSRDVPEHAGGVEEENDDRKLKVTAKVTWVTDDPAWISITSGESLYTNGRIVDAKYHDIHHSNVAYEVRNAAGIIGFINCDKSVVEFC